MKEEHLGPDEDSRACAFWPWCSSVAPSEFAAALALETNGFGYIIDLCVRGADQRTFRLSPFRVRRPRPGYLTHDADLLQLFKTAVRIPPQFLNRVAVILGRLALNLGKRGAFQVRFHLEDA